MKQQRQRGLPHHQLEGCLDEEKVNEEDKAPGYPNELPNDNVPYGEASMIAID